MSSPQETGHTVVLGGMSLLWIRPTRLMMASVKMKWWKTRSKVQKLLQAILKETMNGLLWVVPRTGRIRRQVQRQNRRCLIGEEQTIAPAWLINPRMRHTLIPRLLQTISKATKTGFL